MVLHWTGSGAFNRLLVAARKQSDDVSARTFSDTAQYAEDSAGSALRRTHAVAAAKPGRMFSLADFLDEALRQQRCSGAHARGRAQRTSRRSVPIGSALHLLANAGGGTAIGGLGTIGIALEASAKAAGAEISLGLEVADIRLRSQRAVGVRLADGTPIEARAVISTLDLRRTFFSLFAWKDLPKSVAERVSRYRHAAGVRAFAAGAGYASDA